MCIRDSYYYSIVTLFSIASLAADADVPTRVMILTDDYIERRHLLHVLDAVGQLAEVAVLERRVEWNGYDGAVDSGHGRLLAGVTHLVWPRSADDASIVDGQPRPTVGLPRHHGYFVGRSPLPVSDGRTRSRCRRKQTLIGF